MKLGLIKDKAANVDMILTAVVAGIIFAISIAIIYAVLGGISYTTYDATLRGLNLSGQNYKGHGLGMDTNMTPAANASNSLQTSLATFFTLGPIYIVVIAAVAIIAAIMLLRGRR